MLRGVAEQECHTEEEDDDANTDERVAAGEVLANVSENGVDSTPTGTGRR